MKKLVFMTMAAAVLFSCSSDDLVDKSVANGEIPIAFTIEKKNITRGTQNLEATGHYNFGVWAYKYKEAGASSQQVMDNYLVGYSDNSNKGYDHSGSTTYADNPGSVNDHKSPWFYEHLGTSEYNYNGTAGFYKTGDNRYMSANANQYLRYWDLAFATTNFYAYAPYRSAGVTFDEENKKITVAHTAQVAGYDDASLQEFIYAGTTAKNSDLQDVKLAFKHLGAQVNLRFYEDVRGYKVQIIDVTTDGSGIQATPATMKETTTPTGTVKTYATAAYYTDCGATIDYSTVDTPTATVNHTGATTTKDNLKFAIPNKTVLKDHLAEYTANVTGEKHYIVPEKVDDAAVQDYAVSPTIYYPVAQPADSEVGFTFHVSYKLIAEDNGEVVVVNDARVYVPASDATTSIAAWQPNTKYTYTFKIIAGSTGSTDPAYTEVTNPDVPGTPTTYPIVFDGATIEDYTENATEY